MEFRPRCGRFDNEHQTVRRQRSAMQHLSACPVVDGLRLVPLHCDCFLTGNNIGVLGSNDRSTVSLPFCHKDHHGATFVEAVAILIDLIDKPPADMDNHRVFIQSSDFNAFG